MKWLMIKWKINSYAYELELSLKMKVHLTFHVSLLWFLKDNLISRQVLLLQLTIVENEKDSYFVDLIDNMKWNMKSVQFELLIKWKEYEQKTWKSYTMIKKNASILIKKFHEDHSSWSVSTEWIKEENWWLLSDTWFTKQITNTWFTKIERAWSIVAHEQRMNMNTNLILIMIKNHMTKHDTNMKILKSSI